MGSGSGPRGRSSASASEWGGVGGENQGAVPHLRRVEGGRGGACRLSDSAFAGEEEDAWSHGIKSAKLNFAPLPLEGAVALHRSALDRKTATAAEFRCTTCSTGKARSLPAPAPNGPPLPFPAKQPTGMGSRSSTWSASMCASKEVRPRRSEVDMEQECTLSRRRGQGAATPVSLTENPPWKSWQG